MLILEPGEIGSLIPRSDRRWEHVKKILKKGPGDRLSAGIAVGSPFASAPASVGEAVVRALDDAGLVLDFRPFEGGAGDPPSLPPLRLILGCPRPIQAGRIFKDLASLGVAVIEACGTDLGEKSYLESGFFKLREWRRPLVEGAEQAANPRLPRVALHWTLARCLDALDTGTEAAKGPATEEPEWRAGHFIALHPAPGAQRLGAYLAARGSAGGAGGIRPITMAIGSERGWSEREVALLTARGFAMCALGTRILKTETATVVAAALALQAMGLA
jgi:16S rRNA U1498 N3-methylase RsmE